MYIYQSSVFTLLFCTLEFHYKPEMDFFFWFGIKFNTVSSTDKAITNTQSGPALQDCRGFCCLLRSWGCGSSQLFLPFIIHHSFMSFINSAKWKSWHSWWSNISDTTNVPTWISHGVLQIRWLKLQKRLFPTCRCWVAGGDQNQASPRKQKCCIAWRLSCQQEQLFFFVFLIWYSDFWLLLWS